MINIDSSFFIDLKETQKEYYCKHPPSATSKSHLFKITSLNPTFAIIKPSAAAIEEVTENLAKGIKHDQH